MKVLVVGGAGYIGSHVVIDLLDHGHEVVVFDNLSSGMRENLKEEVFFIHGDILIPNQIQSALEKGFDAVIHLAAFKAAGESMLSPHKYSVNNICGTLNLLGAMNSTGCKKIVFSSSAAVYGEPQYIPIDEEHSKAPENYYGYTKLKIEEFLHWYEKLLGFKSASLRYFNAAGYDSQGRVPGLEQNPANLLPIIMEAAIGMRKHLEVFGHDYPTPDGTCIRDYVHVSDLARAHTLGLEYIDSQNKSLTLNLGSEKGISVKEMIDLAHEITGVPFKVKNGDRRPGDPARLIASSKKAQELLGWEAKHSHGENLLQTTWKVYKNRKNT